jgi:catechol 2,3-dioxygenase-like lactoylglutathione lyase family enzyme
VLTIPGNGFALRLVEFSGVGRRAPLPRMQDVGAVRFGVVVRRIDATFAELTKLGAAVVTQSGSPVLFPQGGGGTVRAVALRDPDGVLIELLQIDPAPPTGPAASGGVLNARFVLCARDAFRSLGFYRTVFGLEEEKVAFWDPEKKPIRVEWSASPGSMNVFDTPGARFRFVLGHFPGLPDLWEFTEYKDVERRQLRSEVFDPGAIVLSLRVRDPEAVLRAFQAAGGTLVSSRGSQGAVFVRDLDGLLLELLPARVD